MRIRKISNFNLSELILVISIVAMIATISATVILMITASVSRNNIEHETGRFINKSLTEMKEEIKNAKQICTREIHEIVTEKNIYSIDNSSDKYFCDGLVPVMDTTDGDGYSWLLLKNSKDIEVLYTVEDTVLYKQEPYGTDKVKISENVNINFKQRNNTLDVMKIEVDLMTTKKKDVFHTYDFYVNLQNDIDVRK